MKHTRSILAALAVVSALSVFSVAGIARVLPDDEYQISEMRIQTLQPMRFARLRHEVTFMEMGAVIGPAIEKCLATAAQGKLGGTAGSIVFQYRGMTGDPAQKFTLDIGMPVTPEAKAVDDFVIDEMPLFRCATVVFSGPLSKMPEAYQKLMADLTAEGLTPTELARESYLYWEGPDSPNNIVHIAIGVK